MFLTKWRYWFWDRMRPARIVAREACQNTLICSLWGLEVMDFMCNILKLIQINLIAKRIMHFRIKTICTL